MSLLKFGFLGYRNIMTLEGVSNMGILSYDQNNSCEITMNGCQARKIEMRKVIFGLQIHGIEVIPTRGKLTTETLNT